MVVAAAAVAATSEEELCGQGSPSENCQPRSGERRRATEDEREEALYSFLRHIMRAGKYMLSRVKRAGIKILGEETATDANLSIPTFRTRRVVGLEALPHFVRIKAEGWRGSRNAPDFKVLGGYVWSRRMKRRRIPACNFKSPPLKNATVFLVPSVYFSVVSSGPFRGALSPSDGARA